MPEISDFLALRFFSHAKKGFYSIFPYIIYEKGEDSLDFLGSSCDCDNRVNNVADAEVVKWKCEWKRMQNCLGLRSSIMLPSSIMRRERQSPSVQ